MENIKIHVLQTGTVCVDLALPFKSESKNPIAYTGIGRNQKKSFVVTSVSLFN